MAIPRYEDLYNPTLEALHKLGGSGTNEEIEEKIAQILQLTDKDLQEPHKGSHNRTEISYRIAWSRNYLKRYGLLENPARGVWTLTEHGLRTTKVDEMTLKRYVWKRDRLRDGHPEIADEQRAEGDLLRKWEVDLLDTIRTIGDAVFERLCQRILRESGFTDVEVTGRPGDGGIDGRAIYKVNGLIALRVVFQCKRYKNKNTVGAPAVRDFRGSMSGRTEYGIFLTTSTFTQAAHQEAVREGSTLINLIDGAELVGLLKNLSMGIKGDTVDRDWFEKV